MHEYRGAAIAIAGLIVVFACLVGAVIIVVSWLGVTGYAIWKAASGGADAPDPAGIIICLVVLITWLVALLAVAIRYLGKGMESPKRRDRDAEAIGL